MTLIIELDEVCFHYPVRGTQPIPALSNISLKIEAGERLAIIGANGSGKSTLARHLNALLIPDQGRVIVSNMDTRDASLHRKIRTQVGVVFQSPEDQIVATTIEEDVAFGPENLGLPATEIRERVEHALHQVNMWQERMRPPHLLSAGQMQRVALAGALAMRPQCIIFDESSAMLDPRGRQMVLAEMASLHRQGLTIIHITHFMEEAAMADRVIMLHLGRVILDGSPQYVFNQTDTLAGIGLDVPPAALIARSLQQYLPQFNNDILTTEDLLNTVPPYHGTRAAQPHPFLTDQEHNLNNSAIIDVHDLAYTYMVGTPLAHPALNGVSLDVMNGSIHALLGATGSGKSTLLQHMNALLHPHAGSVRVGKYQLDDPRVDITAVRKLAGLVFQNPELQLFEQYVGDEIAYGLRLGGMQNQVDLRDRVRWAMEMTGLEYEAFKDRITFSLSGGERRKVTLASILAMQPQILLLDEPLAGLDPASRNDMLSRFKEFNASGITLLLSTHHMEDAALLADRITVMENGKDHATGTPAQIFASSSAIRRLSLETPIVVQTAEQFRQQGWDLPPGIVDPQALVEWIHRMTKA